MRELFGPQMGSRYDEFISNNNEVARLNALLKMFDVPYFAKWIPSEWRGTAGMHHPYRLVGKTRVQQQFNDFAFMSFEALEERVNFLINAQQNQ